MANQIPVQFNGEGSGVGRLTWGQRGVWRTITRQGHSVFVGGVSPVLPGATVEDMAEALGFLMGRHQSLRTKLFFDDDGEPHQQVFESGVVQFEVVDAGDADPGTVAEHVRDRYQSTDFDYSGEWPVRMATVCRDGVPTHLVAVYNHLAVDAASLTVLFEDLLARDPATGAAAGPVTATQPLQLARQQETPSARRQNDNALRHWARVLRSVSPRRFRPSDDEREPRWWDMAYYSPAAAMAMRTIAGRLGTDTSPVLLAGYAVALARTVGYNPVVVQVAVGNRFRPGLADAVMPLAQASPCFLDVAGITFDEAVGRAYTAAMATYLNAYYEPTERAELVAAINEERGEEIDIQCYFNDRRENRDQPAPLPTMVEIEAALPLSKLSWGPHSVAPQPTFYLDVNDAEDGVEFTMTADTRVVSPVGMAAVVRALEAVVVEAARDSSVPTGVLADVEPLREPV